MAGERVRGRTRHSTGLIEDWNLAVRPAGQDRYEVSWGDGRPIAVEIIVRESDAVSERFRVRIEGREREIVLGRDRRPDGSIGVGLDGYHARIAADFRGRATAVKAGSNRRDAEWLCAPFQSLVAEVLVAAGDAVSAGQPVVRLESMKVLTTLDAPKDGVAAEVLVTAGQSVEGGQQLVRFVVPPALTQQGSEDGERT